MDYRMATVCDIHGETLPLVSAAALFLIWEEGLEPDMWSAVHAVRRKRRLLCDGLL